MSRLSGPQLVGLKNAVVEHFDSSDWRELGALTDMLDEVEQHPRLLRSLGFGDDDYDGLALKFLRKMIGSKDENLEIVRHYVAQKCPESGEDISSERVPGRKIVFAPNIFAVPDVSVDPDLISVMMPLSSDFFTVYESIRDAAEQEKFVCKRADDIWDHSTIIQDIFTLIFQSYIVVCDFTGKNANVFYEAGIAHTLGKHVVPITQNDSDIPFDLKHHRYAKYLNNQEGLDKLTSDLRSRFEILAGKRFG